jgi:hypothetical protein
MSAIYTPSYATPKSGQNQQLAGQGAPPIAYPVPADGLGSEQQPRTRLEETSNKLLPFATSMAFGACRPRVYQDNRSFRFYPPDCYQLSSAETSSLLRDHLPPHTASLRLGSPLVLHYLQPLLSENDMRLPQLPRTPGKLRHPQSPNGFDQVSGFALFCTLTLPSGRIRFTCAMGSLLPIASFRPCRCRQRPCDSDCLPLGRGDACFLQQAGVARYAGQTKKQARNFPDLLQRWQLVNHSTRRLSARSGPGAQAGWVLYSSFSSLTLIATL